MHCCTAKETQVDLVREHRDSKCIGTQVQFRTGQREALLTMITVREHLDSISLSAPLFSV